MQKMQTHLISKHLLCFSMGIQNRKKIWSCIKKIFCSAEAENQVIPAVAIINDQENYIPAPVPAPASSTDSTEILNIFTISVTIVMIILHYVIIRLSSPHDSVVVRDLMSLLTRTITHVTWIIVSPKLRQYVLNLKLTIWG